MDIEAQLKPLTQAGRLGFLLKARLNGTITPEEYDFYLHMDFGDTDTTAIEETGEVRADTGQSPTDIEGEQLCGTLGGVLEYDDGKDTEGRTNINETLTQESFVTALERDDKSVLPGRTNGSGLGETGTHSDIIGGDSQNARVWRLLQDGDWHDANEIQQRVYGAQNGLCAIPSRVSNINAKLREKGKGKIESRVKKGSLWEWRYVEKDGFAETVRNISSG